MTAEPTTVSNSHTWRVRLDLRVASLALFLTALFWIWLSLEQWMERLHALALWHLATVAATGFAAGFLFKRSARSPSAPFRPTLTWILALYNAAWAAFLALHGRQIFWLAATTAVLSVIALGDIRRLVCDTESEPQRKEVTLATWARENAEAIVVAFIMALVIRCFCIEVFKIPSSSMEPTLLGDLSGSHPPDTCPYESYHVAGSGDRIMVTKYYHALSPVERFDVVVFKFPLNQIRNFIKRVVGLPNEELFIAGGNVYYRPRDNSSPHFTLARKPLRIQQSLWVTMLHSGFATDRARFDAVWSASKGEHADYDVHRGTLRTIEKRGSRSARFQYVPDITDRNDRSEYRGQPVGDAKIALDVALQDATGRFFMEVSNEQGVFLIELSGGHGLLKWRDVHGKESVQPLLGVSFESQRSYSLELLVYDGAALALVDRNVRAELVWLDTYHKAIGETLSPARIAFGSDGTLFTASEIEIGRDIYYKGQSRFSDPEQPHKTEPDCFVMMGDNVNNSHDSRGWTEKLFTLRDGSEIRCEGLAIKDNVDLKERWAAAHGQSEPPDYYIEADSIGYERGIYLRDLKKDPDESAFTDVHEKFLVGKALWIWWPPGRWGRLIR